MKHLKVMSITFLVFLLLLTGCSIRAEQNEETEETDWEEIFPFEDFAETETNTAQANETISLSHSDSIFNAKFEGDKVAGKGEIVDGVYRFNASRTDGEAWHVKLECNYPTVAGRDYFVTYKFNSNVAGKVKFGDFQEFRIQKGENSITGIMIATGGLSYLDLQLGMLSPFTIDFTQIEVKEFEDEMSYEDALPAPINFERESRVYERHDSGYMPVLIRRENVVNLNYLSAPMDSGVWKSRLYVRTGLIPEPGVRYRVSADIACDEDMPFELLFNNGEEEKGYGALYGQKVEANKTKKIEAVITGNGNVDELILQASLGEAPDGGKVIFGNVKVEKIKDEYKSVLPADFRLDNSLWTGRYINRLIPTAFRELPVNISYDAFETVYEQHDEGYVVELKEIATNAFLKIKEAPAKAEDRGVWKVRLYAATGVSLVKGKTYRVKYDLVSNVDQAEYEACFDGNKENAYGVLYGRSLKAGQTDHVEQWIMPEISSGPLTLRLQLGKTDTAAGNKFLLSGFSLEEVGQEFTNVPLTDFSYDTSDANVREQHDEGYVQSVTVSGNSATLDIQEAPESDRGVWKSKLLIDTGVTPEAGTRYAVSFDISGSKNQDKFEACFDGNQENKYGALYDQKLVAGETKTIRHGFDCVESAGPLKIRLQLGKTNDASGNEITVSNIKVCKIVGTEAADITPENFAYPVTTEASTKDNSFKVENNEGAQAELTGDGSSATAKVVKSGDDWHIKFYAFTGAELKKGQTYHVTMDVAGADGCGVAFKNPSVEGETGFGSGTITGGKIDQTITPEENGTLEVILKIGTVAAGNEVKVSNFKIEEVKETEGENLMTDPLKVQAPQINSWNHDDYVTSLSNTDSSATMNIEKVPASGREAWKIKLFAETHQKLEAGKTYRVSVDVQSASSMGYEICYNNASAEKELGTKPGLNASSTKQTVTYNVSPSKEAELTLQFNLGNAAGANSFTISNIKIEDAKEVSSKNLIPNFRYNAVGYLNGMADEGYVTSFRRDDSSATFKIKKAPDERNPWNAKVVARTGFTPEAGKGYRVSVDIDSKADQKLFEIFYDGNKELDYGALYEQKLTAGKKTFSYIIYPGDSKGELSLQLRFGKTDDNSGNKYTISNIRIEEVTFTSSSTKEIKNASELVTQSGYSAELIKSANRASVRLIKTPKNGREAWKNKLFINPGVKLEQGQKYRITAVVKSIIPAPFEICLNDGDVEKGLGGIFGLMSRPQGTYISYASYVPKDIDLAVQLSLGNCAAPNTITFSDVKVEKAGKINQISDKIYVFR